MRKVVESYEAIDSVEFHTETCTKTRRSETVYNYKLLMRKEIWRSVLIWKMVKKYSKKDLKVIEKTVRRIFSGNERIVAADSRSCASVVIEWVREAADLI